MIKDDAVRFLEEINNSKEYARFGKCFKTKEKSTFMILGRVKYVNVSKKSMNC